MKRNDYLFAVASVRALENSLLTRSDLEQLINAESYEKAVTLLNEKGYNIPSGGNYSKTLDVELNGAWDYIKKAAPEAEALNAFIIKNDFQNLKAILKAEAMGHSADDYFVKPCAFDAEKLKKAVSERRFDELPECAAGCAEKALELLSTTGRAQLCDTVIDTAALEAILCYAKSSNDDVLINYAEEYCVATNIKTAYRAVKTGKNSVYLDMAIANCEKLKKADFVNAAADGMEEFCDYLTNTGFSDYRAELEKGGSAFEKYCDDKLLEIVKKAKMTAFGISPLAAYYCAKETEVKCLRVILSAKQSHVSTDVIRERMRELYV